MMKRRVRQWWLNLQFAFGTRWDLDAYVAVAAMMVAAEARAESLREWTSPVGEPTEHFTGEPGMLIVCYPRGPEDPRVQVLRNYADAQDGI